MASLMISYGEVYNELSYHKWQSAMEIRDCIAKKRETNNTLLGTGSIYIHLEDMVKDKLVDRRDRELSEQQLQIRGGKAQPEFKLTSNGLRRQLDTQQRTINRLEGTLPPAH